jgi:hypothetical protein
VQGSVATRGGADGRVAWGDATQVQPMQVAAWPPPPNSFTFTLGVKDLGAVGRGASWARLGGAFRASGTFRMKKGFGPLARRLTLSRCNRRRALQTHIASLLTFLRSDTAARLDRRL